MRHQTQIQQEHQRLSTQLAISEQSAQAASASSNFSSAASNSPVRSSNLPMNPTSQFPSRLEIINKFNLQSPINQ
ncbi:hypothetical protein FGO68_gene10449 [Halteria grandinella]|uniref:Uncharacterized protein n=1 Tax=Halteria grandinella TaxID=5974 RepID=A0A8J8T8V5_HALGN|nr:hypothetical protein FGO68_gene10449 [Halteria grandinella]